MYIKLDESKIDDVEKLLETLRYADAEEIDLGEEILELVVSHYHDEKSYGYDEDVIEEATEIFNDELEDNKTLMFDDYYMNDRYEELLNELQCQRDATKEDNEDNGEYGDNEDDDDED